jgi:HAD superfamily phosphatase (TIGR01681 family)
MTEYLCKLVIFDLDGTLHSHNDIINDNATLKKEIYDILDFLKKNNIKIALASLNSDAIKYLKRYKIFEYFDYIEYKNWLDYGDHKTDLFSFIQKKSNIPYNKMLFFDDRKHHLLEASKLQMKNVIVDQYNLLSWEDLMKGFSSFTYDNKPEKQQETTSIGIQTCLLNHKYTHKNKKRKVKLQIDINAS